jgi:hypothetical protein
MSGSGAKAGAKDTRPNGVAEFLCRSDTLGDVRKKAEEFGQQFKTKV